MEKKIVFAMVAIFMTLTTFVFAGHGPFAPEQPGLLEKCKTWKPGDEIPEYLLTDSTNFNPMSDYKPIDYIWQIDNKELLFNLVVHSKSPSFNSDTAFLRLLNRLGLSEFKSFLDKTLFNPKLIKNKKVAELKNIFSDKCLKVYTFYIKFDDMSKDEALKVLSQMKSELDSGEDYMKIYKIYAKKYEYQNPQFPKQYLTKIGNGGDFYISRATMNMFPSAWIPTMPNIKLKQIVDLKIRDSIILEESMDEKDKELRAKYGNLVATHTENRLNLFVVIESLEKNK